MNQLRFANSFTDWAIEDVLPAKLSSDTGSAAGPKINGRQQLTVLTTFSKPIQCTHIKDIKYTVDSVLPVHDG